MNRSKLHWLFAVAALAMASHQALSQSAPGGPQDSPKQAEAAPRAMGLVVPKDWDVGVTHLRTAEHLAGVLPARFDWRDQGALTPVKDQKQCGSCWAFGSTATLEAAVKIKDGKELDLSEQELVSKDSSSYGCSGGFFAHAYQQKYGQSLEAWCPYTARNSACPSQLAPAAKLDSWAYVGRRGRRPTRDELKTAIYQHGPVTATVAANGAFVRYPGGVFKGCTATQTNHMINLVGWDDNEGVWILRNSWSADWGEKGYMRIPYGCSRVGESAAYVVYKPACANVPKVRFPRLVTAGRDGAEIGVEAQAGAFYRWFDDGLPVGNRTSKLKVKPRRAHHYTLRVTTECGEAESTVRVVPAAAG